MSVRIAVFASGGGSNFQALLESFATSGSATIALLITDRPDAGALRRAATAGVPALHIRAREREPAEIEREMMQALGDHDISFIALAGYLRLIPAGVTAAFRGRIVNIHPALLPAFGGSGMYGQRVHAAVLAAGCRVTGATVHWVDEHYDEGGIIAQWPVPVLPDDTPGTLAARVLRVEHRLYPAVVAALVRRQSGVAAVAHATVGATAPAALHETVFRLLTTIDGLEAEITAAAGL